MSQPTNTEQQLMAGVLWDNFCDELKAAGRLITADDLPADPVNRMLGYRFLTHIVRAGLEAMVDYANPAFPAFFRLADETKKMLNDNPDNYYYNCAIAGQYDYKITGHRGTVNWFSLGSKGSSAEIGDMVSTGDLDSRNMVFNADGSFEIWVTKERKQGNWLPITDASQSIIIRQTFGDRANEETATFAIECLNPPAGNNIPCIEQFAQSLANTVHFTNSTVAMTVDWMRRYRRQHPNALPEDDQALCQASGGDPQIHYYQSFWQLGADQALLVTLSDIPECQTWNLQLSNFWMESLDYRFFNICVNKHTAHYEANGSVIIVISQRNPGKR